MPNEPDPTEHSSAVLLSTDSKTRVALEWVTTSERNGDPRSAGFNLVNTLRLAVTLSSAAKSLNVSSEMFTAHHRVSPESAVEFGDVASAIVHAHFALRQFKDVEPSSMRQGSRAVLRSFDGVELSVETSPVPPLEADPGYYMAATPYALITRGTWYQRIDAHPLDVALFARAVSAIGAAFMSTVTDKRAGY